MKIFFTLKKKNQFYLLKSLEQELGCPTNLLHTYRQWPPPRNIWGSHITIYNSLSLRSTHSRELPGPEQSFHFPQNSLWKRLGTLFSKIWYMFSENEREDCHLPVVQNNTIYQLYKRCFSAASLMENILCRKMWVLLQLLALVGCNPSKAVITNMIFLILRLPRGTVWLKNTYKSLETKNHMCKNCLQ